MNCSHLLSLCLLIPVLLQGAASEEMFSAGNGCVESLSAGIADMNLAGKKPINNMHTLLMYRQLGKPLPEARKKVAIDQEKARIMREAGTNERSCIPMSFSDARLNGRPKMTMIAFERIKRLGDGRRYGVFVRPYPLSFLARIEIEGKQCDGMLRPFNRIDIDDFQDPEHLRFMGTYAAGGNGIAISTSPILPTVTFTHAQVQVVHDEVVGVILHNTGIDEIDCKQLQSVYPNMELVTLPQSVPYSSRVRNAHNAAGTNVDIIYRDTTSDYAAINAFLYPVEPSAELRSRPAFGEIEHVFVSHENRATEIFKATFSAQQ